MGQSDLELSTHPAEDLDGSDRVPTQLEEVVVHADAPHRQKFLPDLAHRLFHQGGGRPEGRGRRPIALELVAAFRSGCSLSVAVELEGAHRDDDVRGQIGTL